MKKLTRHLPGLEERLGYSFQRASLLARALTHRSFTFEQQGAPREDNETLEFLGDAVLDLVIGSLLFRQFPQKREGELTKLRSTLVQENHLAAVARELNLGACLFLGKGEEKSGGREKASILACTYEAVIGAIFHDSDYETARQVIEKHFTDKIQLSEESVKIADAKSRLQELTQEKSGDIPNYILDKSEGPDHDKSFTISIHFQGSILATATAKSKKAAEQKAAALAVAALGGTSGR